MHRNVPRIKTNAWNNNIGAWPCPSSVTLPAAEIQSVDKLANITNRILLMSVLRTHIKK